jgi:hypothetical protein
MKNQNIDILNEVIKRVLTEQTGLVDNPDHPANKKKKAKSSGGFGLDDLAAYSWLFYLIAATVTSVWAYTGGLRRLLSRMGIASETAAANKLNTLSVKKLLDFRKGLDSPKSRAKLRQMIQDEFEAGKITHEERKATFEILDNPTVIKLMEDKIFNNVYKRFKRGEISSKELIANLDVETAREVGPTLRSMEQQGLAGKQSVEKAVKQQIKKVQISQLKNPGTRKFNNILTKFKNDTELRKDLNFIYGRETVENWAQFYNKKGSTNLTSGLLKDHIARLQKEFASDKTVLMFKDNIPNFETWKMELKKAGQELPWNPQKEWKYYQFKQLMRRLSN